MNKKYKVLVVPHKTAIGEEIKKSLKWSKHFEVVEDTCTKTVFEEGFVKEVEKQAENCDFILTAHDESQYLISKTSLCDKLVGHCRDTIHACRWKTATYALLQICHPEIVPNLYLSKINKEIRPTEADFPLFIKPRNGQGSRGDYRKINSFNELVFLTDPGTWVLSEYLPGKEYTVDCFSHFAGTVMFSSARERLKTINGIAVDTEIVSNQKLFSEIANKINSVLHMSGAWFFQVKEDREGNLKVLEVGARIAGSSGINRFNNVNLVELSLWNHLGTDVTVSPQQFTTQRKTPIGSTTLIPKALPKTIYVDLDDTLILDEECINGEMLNGTLNSELWSKLYKRKLEGHIIKLITKNYNPYKSLESAGMIRAYFAGLFHDEILIGSDCAKSAYIYEPCIFIDDSYYQRRQVLKGNYNCFVFSPVEAVEIL